MNEETNTAEAANAEATGMEAALESAVSEVMATEAAEREATDAGKIVDVAAKEEVKGEGEGVGEGGQRSEQHAVEKAPEPDFTKEQELFDRAVRAGISVKDVLAIPTYDMAKRMVEIAERSHGEKKEDLPDKGKEGGDAGTPVDELGAALAEMEKDGEYDPKILKLLKGLYNENQSLKTAGKTAAKQTFFEQQFGSLDESLRGRVDAVHKSQLKSKFDLLEAGYRAQGSHIQREDVFREAAKLALGDLMGKVAEERKTAALEQRKNLTLARPGGETGKRRGTGPATDEEIASEIWDMIR